MLAVETRFIANDKIAGIHPTGVEVVASLLASRPTAGIATIRAATFTTPRAKLASELAAERDAIRDQIGLLEKALHVPWKRVKGLTYRHAILSCLATWARGDLKIDPPNYDAINAGAITFTEVVIRRHNQDVLSVVVETIGLALERIRDAIEVAKKTISGQGSGSWEDRFADAENASRDLVEMQADRDLLEAARTSILERFVAVIGKTIGSVDEAKLIEGLADASFMASSSSPDLAQLRADRVEIAGRLELCGSESDTLLAKNLRTQNEAISSRIDRWILSNRRQSTTLAAGLVARARSGNLEALAELGRKSEAALGDDRLATSLASIQADVVRSIPRAVQIAFTV